MLLRVLIRTLSPAGVVGSRLMMTRSIVGSVHNDHSRVPRGGVDNRPEREEAVSEVWAWFDTVPPDSAFYFGCAALLLCAFWRAWRRKP